MHLNLPREWYERNLPMEDDLDCTVISPRLLRMLTSPTPEDEEETMNEEFDIGGEG